MQGTHRGRLFSCTEWETFPDKQNGYFRRFRSARRHVAGLLAVQKSVVLQITTK